MAKATAKEIGQPVESTDKPSTTGDGPSRIARRGFIVLTSITVAIGGFLFGYDTAVISGAILFVRSQFHLSSVQTEVAVSIVLAGALAGTAVDVSAWCQ
jgi:hypothetical protein